MEKLDMSSTCKFEYNQRWMDANVYKTTSQEDWLKWYREHCLKCKYMCDICMHGEE